MRRHPSWTTARSWSAAPELVARFTADGRPDTSWSADGEVTVGDHEGIVTAAADGAWVVERVDSTHVRVHHLDATGSEDRAATHPVLDAGTVKDARALPDGRLAFIPFPDASLTRPYIVSPDATTIASGPRADSGGHSDLHVVGDELATIGPVASHFGVSRYDLALRRTGGASLNIVDSGPAVTILSGPRRGFGVLTDPANRFHFALEQRPEDLGYATLLCSFDQEPERGCQTDEVYYRLQEGPASLQVWGIGIHGVPGPRVDYDWEINTHPPNTSIFGRPAARHGKALRGDLLRDDGRDDDMPRRRRVRAWLHLAAEAQRAAAWAAPRLDPRHRPGGERRPHAAIVAWRIGPSATLSARGTLTLLALHRGHATVRVTNLRTHRTSVHRVSLRAFRARTVRVHGTRLRVTARLPGVRRPLTVARR